MSEKQSDISIPPLEKPTLLLDENLSSADISLFLRRLKDWIIELSIEHLGRGASDVEVIRFCASRGWILISCDDRIRYVPANKKAALDYKVKAFMFHDGNHQGVEYAAALTVGRKHLLRTTIGHAGPLLARVQFDGEIAVLHPQVNEAAATSRERTQLKYGKKVGD